MLYPTAIRSVSGSLVNAPRRQLIIAGAVFIRRNDLVFRFSYSTLPFSRVPSRSPTPFFAPQTSIPRPLRISPLYSPYSTNAPPEKPTNNVEISKPENKPTLWEKVKHEARHYWDGTKLFGKEIKISTKLFIKMLSGTQLTRREQRQLKRTLSDLVRLVPFSLFVIIPFAELLLPFALKLFPNLLPSTYEDPKSAEAKKSQLLQTRKEVSKYLRDTIQESLESKKKKFLVSSETSGTQPQSFENVDAILTKIRTSGGQVTPQDVAMLTTIFKDDLTLDNLTRPQLVSVCRYLGIPSYGTDNYIKHNITKRLKYIRADDQVISSEGLDTLTVSELQSACLARGIKVRGESPAMMRENLESWIRLHLELETPALFLILAKILSAGDHVHQSSIDIIKATLSSLPESLVNEATLTIAENQGKATNQHRLEVLEEQEELIQDESEQEEKRLRSQQNSSPPPSEPSEPEIAAKPESHPKPEQGFPQKDEIKAKSSNEDNIDIVAGPKGTTTENETDKTTSKDSVPKDPSLFTSSTSSQQSSSPSTSPNAHH
ncbi:hypothetical protein BB560_003116 [Smittium megazygosporum]|uniref:Letm1 RBD domain-containing protein n=1 Tax=Smittium megazygosporum TaxID=133381 RepID=A0A2T9YKU6_9FUNG|nr:hypothetical protein BB560_006021 [Smittium megazygosporum]PVV02428.1 hypothetical protein BB560_003116 [Smittium megazygosporum]